MILIFTTYFTIIFFYKKGAAGGGGGTFVADGELLQPLIIAAGGSGANWYSFSIDGPSGQLPDPLTESLKTTEASAERGGGGKLISLNN